MFMLGSVNVRVRACCQSQKIKSNTGLHCLKKQYVTASSDGTTLLLFLALPLLCHDCLVGVVDTPLRIQQMVGFPLGIGLYTEDYCEKNLHLARYIAKKNQGKINI